jgi:riboflavin synthase
MFTGIVESQAILIKHEAEQGNLHLWFRAAFANELKPDQSVAHNGVCLTVVEVNGSDYKVTAIAETLQKSNIGNIKINDKVNLERCMPALGRFDGHMVQGHVDTVSECVDRKENEGSTIFTFRIEEKHAELIVEKGSICVNGVSLTVVDARRTQFSVHIIPYTLNHTNFAEIIKGSKVNLEFDIIGKYLLRKEWLRDNKF